jgi:hypothetical protein
MTEPLSPAAQAVFSAWAKPVDIDRSLVISGQALEAQARGALAAALRAAADQVVPHLEEPDWGSCDYMDCDIELYTDHQRKRAELLAIADELERIN